MTFEVGTEGAEFVPEFTEVINLTVENEPVTGCRVLHGLVPEGREINDRQPGVSETKLKAKTRAILDDDCASVIRATVG